ncbi:MAG: NmrA/HSCARG family protein [Nannocystaceae bacterium]
MSDSSPAQILVIGATGTQGRAVSRQLLARGFAVRGLTRNPTSPAAQRLAGLGATPVAGDLDDATALEAAMRGVHGVYLVTEFFKNGIEGELRHGKRVAELAKRVGVRHLVHASVAGADRRSGVPHFDSKGEIEAHIRSLGIPATFLRPTIFMEDLTDKQYFPPASWGMMPKILGPDRPVKWIGVDDIGAAAAEAFTRGQALHGAAIALVGDVRSMAASRELFRRVRGKAPFALPMPTFLFRRLISEELVRMWEWLAAHEMDGDVAATRALVPDLKDMETWLRGRVAADAARAG